jgi:PAS domain S-box-containing protein
MSGLALNMDFTDLPNPVIVYDVNGDLVQANQAALQILGASDELIGTRAADAGWLITDPAGWPDAVSPHPALSVIRTGKPQLGVVARVIRSDGAEAWIHADAMPVRNDAQTISHVLVMLADITRILRSASLPRPAYGDAAVAAVTEQLASAPPDPERILRTVTSTLSKVRAGTWIAAVMNKDSRWIQLVAAGDSDPRIAEYVHALDLPREPATNQFLAGVIETGKPILVPQVAFDEFIGGLSAGIRDYFAAHEPPLEHPVEHLGILVVPLRARGNVVGALGLFERTGTNPPTELDLRWSQEVADRVGLAVENARQYVDAVKRLERLTALRNVGLAVSGSADLRLTLQVILDQAIAGLGVDAGDVLFLNAAEKTLTLVASSGFHSSSMPDYRLPVDDRLPGRVVNARRIETVTAPGALDQFRRRTLFAREGFQAYGVVPLIAHGKPVGVLEVFHRGPLQPDHEWLEFLNAIGSEAAVAINDAAMFDRLELAGTVLNEKPKMARPELSRMEQEILRHVVEGLSNRLIAERVHRSEHTIKFHVAHLLNKVGVSNRTELTRVATEAGWL